MDPEDIDAFRTSVLDLLNHINGTEEFPIENRCKYIKEAIDFVFEDNPVYMALSMEDTPAGKGELDAMFSLAIYKNIVPTIPQNPDEPDDLYAIRLKNTLEDTTKSLALAVYIQIVKILLKNFHHLDELRNINKQICQTIGYNIINNSYSNITNYSNHNENNSSNYSSNNNNINPDPLPEPAGPVGGSRRSKRSKRTKKNRTQRKKKGGCGCMVPQQGGYKTVGGYRATKKDKKYLNLYKKGKSIGFTMTASLKAKGLISRANGTRRVSKKYR